MPFWYRIDALQPHGPRGRAARAPRPARQRKDLPHAGTVRPRGRLRGAVSHFVIVTFLIVTGVVGLSPGSFGTRAIFLTRSTSLHWPNIGVLAVEPVGRDPSMMKNWLPFVPPPSGTPAFAIASVPGCILQILRDLVVELVARAAGAGAQSDRRPGS